MKKSFALSLSILLVIGSWAVGADHRVEPHGEAPPADELAPEIASALQSTGFKVVRGTSRTVCEIWLCKQWQVSPDFQPTSEVLYPFKPGQLFGVARYPRKGSDFRDQDIDSGVYTLRYAQQPVDGDHIGTSPTRDFLLLVNAQNDQSAAEPEVDDLVEQSAEAAQSSHPAMLCLRRVRGEVQQQATIRHDETHDWWIVSFAGQTKAGDAEKTLPIELVIVGVAAE